MTTMVVLDCCTWGLDLNPVFPQQSPVGGGEAKGAMGWISLRTTSIGLVELVSALFNVFFSVAAHASIFSPWSFGGASSGSFSCAFLNLRALGKSNAM
jgi:hypothetical protein